MMIYTNEPANVFYVLVSAGTASHSSGQALQQGLHGGYG